MLFWNPDDKIILPISLVIIILLSLLIKKITPKKYTRVPFQIISVITIVLEVIKQIKNIVGGYSLWSLPFHVCSLYMLFFLMASFGKKTKDIGFFLSITYGVTFLVSFYLSPDSIIGGASSNFYLNFSSFHTFIYHHFIILFFILTLLFNNYKPQKKHILQTFIFSNIAFAIIITVANLLQINFASLLYHSVPIIEKFRLAYGQVVYSISMYVAEITLITLISYIGYLIYNYSQKNKISKKALS